MVVKHVFVDESKARDYLLVSATIHDSAISAARRTIRGLRLRGQTRVHMKKESDSRRRLILDTIRSLRPGLVVYRAAQRHRTDLSRRAACIEALVARQPTGLLRVVLERDETLVDRDRRTLIEAIRLRPGEHEMHYEHATASEEPLLAIPDAIAWAWARGGAWRSRIRDLEIAVEEA